MTKMKDVNRIQNDLISSQSNKFPGDAGKLLIQGQYFQSQDCEAK